HRVIAEGLHGIKRRVVTEGDDTGVMRGFEEKLGIERSAHTLRAMTNWASERRLSAFLSNTDRCEIAWSTSTLAWSRARSTPMLATSVALPLILSLRTPLPVCV